MKKKSERIPYFVLYDKQNNKLIGEPMTTQGEALRRYNEHGERYSLEVRYRFV